MLAVVLALTAAIGYGGSDFAAGLASRSAPVIQITLLASVIGGVIVAAALPFAASPGRTRPDWPGASSPGSAARWARSRCTWGSGTRPSA
jgi:hypothetical protein